MAERGELRLPEIPRQYVWRSTHVRDLLDSLYRGYPSGAILLWETDEAVPLQSFAASQSNKLLPEHAAPARWTIAPDRAVCRHSRRAGVSARPPPH